jgi:hypothetical protein
MYTAGWIASGPVGVIASTMQRAYAVASTIMMDHFQSPLPPASSSLLSVDPDGCRSRIHQAVEHEDRRVEGLGEDRQGREGDRREEGESQGKVCFGGGYVEGVGLKDGQDEVRFGEREAISI